MHASKMPQADTREGAETRVRPSAGKAVSIDATMPADQIAAAAARLKKQLMEARTKRFAHQRRQLIQPFVLLPAAMRYPTQFILPLSLLAGTLTLGVPAANQGIRKELLTFSAILFPLLYCAALAVAVRDAKAERAVFAEAVKTNLVAEISRTCGAVGAILEDKYIGSLRQCIKDLQVQLKEVQMQVQQRMSDARRAEENKRRNEQNQEAAEKKKKRTEEAAAKKKRQEEDKAARADAQDRRRQLAKAEALRRVTLEKLRRQCADALASAKRVVDQAQQEIARQAEPAARGQSGG